MLANNAKPHTNSASSVELDVKPAPKPASAVSAPSAVGPMNRTPTAPAAPPPHGSDGPTPIRNTISVPSGSASRSNHGPPTDSCRPSHASTTSGNTVPSITNAVNTEKTPF